MNTRRRARTALLTLTIAASSFGVAACGSDDEPSSSAAATTESTTTKAAGSNGAVTIENCGLKLTRKAPPERAISVSLQSTEMLLSLGLEDKMVGSAVWNEKFLPELRAAGKKVTSLGNAFPSFERTMKTEPDFIYTAFSYGFTSEGIAPRDRFTKLGVDTYVSESECDQKAKQTSKLAFEDIFDEIKELSSIFGIEKRGEELIAKQQARLKAVTDSFSQSKISDVSTLWWYAATKTPYVAGGYGAPQMIADLVGVKNVFASNKQLWPEISWEAILERDPDVLVLANLDRGGDGDSVEDKIKFLTTNPVTKRLTAVRNKRFITVGGPDMDPSLRNIDAVEKVADGLRELGLAQ